MDFLKKHGEKIAFALAMLILIGTAVWLTRKVGAITGNVEPYRQLKGGDIAKVTGEEYDQSLTKYLQPMLWTNAPRDPFEPLRAQKATVNTNDPPVPPPPYGQEMTLIRIVRVPFRLLFKAYSYDAKNSRAYNFQINFRDFRRTFFVENVGDEIKDREVNTGYKTTKFQRIITPRFDPSINSTVERDESELTIEHEGEPPKVLPLGREIEDQEPIATVRCADGLQRREVRRAEKFECDGKTYIVVDIKRDRVLIKDPKSGEELTVKLPSATD